MFRVYKRFCFTSRVLLVSLLLAIFTSAYLEDLQVKFFSGVKNYMQSGSFSRFLNEDGNLKTYSDEGYYINPVHVFQQVLAYSERKLIENKNVEIGAYEFFKIIEENDLNVIRISDFVIDQFESENINGVNIIRYPYPINYEKYDLNKPWYSGMAQGHAVIVLLHAWEITGMQKYFDSAILSANVFHLRNEFGGVLLGDNDKGIWLEEYASPTLSALESPRVLNGHVFAVDGLFWIWYLTNDDEYKELLIKAILGVENNIHKYDSGFWSYYDLKYNFANAKYHEIHIEQLRRILEYADILNLKVKLNNVNGYKKKFESYKYFPFFGYVQRLIFQRNRMIYVIYFSNFLLFVCLFAFVGRLVKSIRFMFYKI